MHKFPTDYPSILARLQTVDPLAYSKSRNYLNGATTKLSPYITHGVLTTQDVGKVALTKASLQEAEVLLKELAWRDFYYAYWKILGASIFQDLRYPQTFSQFSEIPTALSGASTGIITIDQSVEELLQTGYIHNHSRLWLAMLCCNIARTAWWNPSRWMYYHLLDGDLASNTISWQWVAGSYRKQPYIANQENLNSYSGITQHDTFLDLPYEKLTVKVPLKLEERSALLLSTELTKTEVPTLSGEILLYHPWSLNPSWQTESFMPRILLLEPQHFAEFPISQKRLAFILDLAKNISGLTVVVADFSELTSKNPAAAFRFIESPQVAHWNGIAEPQKPLFIVRNPITVNWSFSKFWSQRSITISTQSND